MQELLRRTLSQASTIRSLEDDLNHLLTALSANTVNEGVEIAAALIAILDDDH